MKDVIDLDFGAIKAADKLRIEPVDVPEWGGRVYVRTLTAGAYAKYAATVSDGDKVDHEAWQNGLVAAACCDASGASIFPDAATVATLNDAAPVRRIFTAAQKLNKLGRHDLDAEKKDSAETSSGGSPSA